MTTITLTLSAPMASFSSQPRLQHRLTQLTPTKSAIIGMIACAMGLGRDDSYDHLNTLTVSVIDVAGGKPEQDFQTVHDAVTNDGSAGRAAITSRHYIPDYRAVVELTGDDDLITDVTHALQFPHWQLYLGRRAHVLDRPLITIIGEK